LYGAEVKKNVVFIVDVSTSMTFYTPEKYWVCEKGYREKKGTWWNLWSSTCVDDKGHEMDMGQEAYTRLEILKYQLKSIVQQFNDGMAFNIILFSKRIIEFGLKVGTDGNIAAALEWIDQQTVSGGTYLDNALRKGLNVPGVDVIYLMTDGQPTTEAEAKARRYNQTALGVNCFDIECMMKKKKLALNKKVMIHTAFFAPGDTSRKAKVGRQLLEDIAQTTGGNFHDVQKRSCGWWCRLRKACFDAFNWNWRLWHTV